MVSSTHVLNFMKHFMLYIQNIGQETLQNWKLIWQNIQISEYFYGHNKATRRGKTAVDCSDTVRIDELIKRWKKIKNK